ncbi:MAG: low molecular weight phosphotyrosine protein phosphatase [Clostridia bacterium]|nr:low molecular weight phosphotyrosine protein phosphatase [Clostridia bacterium]
MTKILFVCLGNICRSPMAEMIFRYLAEKAGCAKEVLIDSAGTSDEEEGNPLYYAAKEKLVAEGIPVAPHKARRITAADMDTFDHILVMEEKNLRALSRRFGDLPPKVRRLMEVAGEQADVADPWYTRRFDTAFADIWRGCEALLTEITAQKQ